MPNLCGNFYSTGDSFRDNSYDSFFVERIQELQIGTSAKSIIYTKDSALQKEERAFFKNRVKKAFIQWLYYKKLLPWEELPSFLDVHHKHPLGGGGDSSFSNLVILPRRDHEKMNREVIDPQLRGIVEGETREIIVPWWDDSYVDWFNIRKYIDELERSHGRFRGRGSDGFRGRD